MHLKVFIERYHSEETEDLLTDKPPRETSLMDLHARCIDVRRIAEVWEPHILDMQIVECLIEI